MFFDLILSDDLKLINFALNELRNEKLIVCKHFNSINEAIELKEKLEKEFPERIKVSHLMLEAKEKELNEFKKIDFISVLAGNNEMNVFALNKRIKIILNPVNEKKIELDEGLLSNYALEKKIIATSFAFFCEKNELQKALTMKNLMLLGKLAKRTNAIVLTVSGARNLNELRKQKEMLCFSSLFLKEPKEMLEKAFKELFEEKELFKVID